MQWKKQPITYLKYFLKQIKKNREGIAGKYKRRNVSDSRNREPFRMSGSFCDW